MKMDEMLQREDFYRIFEETMTEYFKNVLKKECTVEVVDSAVKEKIVLFAGLNRVITKKPSRDIVRHIYKAFNINDNLVKNLAAKAYIFLHLLFKGKTADKGIRLSDPTLFTDDMAIVPGNKKIRINYYSNKISDLIVKEGFSDRYFQNEVKFRTENRFDFIVPILDHGEIWYRETLLDGRCLARITDKAICERSQERVVECLKQLNRTYSSFLSGKEYAKALKDSISDKFEKVKTEKSDVDFDFEKIRELIKRLSDRVSEMDAVPLTLSHGDMQSGNIIVQDDGSIYIIDWETYATRSIWYDVTTLFLFTRRYNRWKSIIQNRYTKKVQDLIYRIDDARNMDIDQVIAVLLLEDLEFRLTDVLMIPGDRGCCGLNSFINEISEEGLL